MPQKYKYKPIYCQKPEKISKIQFEIGMPERNGTNGVKILERSILIGRIHYFLRTQRVSRLLLKLKSVY